MKLYIKEFYKEEQTTIKISSSLDRQFYWFYQIRNKNKYFFKGIDRQTANWTSYGLKKYIYKDGYVNIILQQIEECKSHNFQEN